MQLVSWGVSKQAVGIWGKLGDSVWFCPHTLTELIFGCSAVDRALTSPLPLLLELEGCTTDIYTHMRTHSLSKRWKTLKLSWEEYIKCLHKPSSVQKQTCSVLFLLFISKLGSLVVYLRNKLAGTRKLPKLPSQKPPIFPDGGLVYWTGKGKKQTKHNCSRFTHIHCTPVQVCAHPRAHTKTLI